MEANKEVVKYLVKAIEIKEGLEKNILKIRQSNVSMFKPGFLMHIVDNNPIRNQNIKKLQNKIVKKNGKLPATPYILICGDEHFVNNAETLIPKLYRKVSEEVVTVLPVKEGWEGIIIGANGSNIADLQRLLNCEIHIVTARDQSVLPRVKILQEKVNQALPNKPYLVICGDKIYVDRGVEFIQIKYSKKEMSRSRVQSINKFNKTKEKTLQKLGNELISKEREMPNGIKKDNRVVIRNKSLKEIKSLPKVTSKSKKEDWYRKKQYDKFCDAQKTLIRNFHP